MPIDLQLAEGTDMKQDMSDRASEGDFASATAQGVGSFEALSVEQAAELLQISRNTLYEAVGRGDVPHRRIGKKIRLSRAAILRWLEGVL